MISNLSPRDLKILALIEQYGVVSSTQIGRWFFAGVAKTTVLRRIRFLTKGNYLRPCVSLDDGTRTFTLGLAARRILGTENSIRFFNRNTINHDVLVSETRWKLESMGLGKEVIPEFQMRREVFRNHRYRRAKEEIIPDGLMIEMIRGKALAIALEVELTVKSKARYEKIFRQYFIKDSVHRIWYFTRTRQDAARLLTAARSGLYGIDKRLWISVVDEFLTAKMPSLFSGLESKWIPVDQIGFDDLKLQAVKPVGQEWQSQSQGVSTSMPQKQEIKKQPKSIESQSDSLISVADGHAPSAPDHPHPTSKLIEGGQERRAEKNTEMSEVQSEVGLLKCG